jgi:hypothetical protein
MKDGMTATRECPPHRWPSSRDHRRAAPLPIPRDERRTHEIIPFPSRLAVWTDLLRATRAALAPHAPRWTLALQFVVAAAVTLR